MIEEKKKTIEDAMQMPDGLNEWTNEKVMYDMDAYEMQLVETEKDKIIQEIEDQIAATENDALKQFVKESAQLIEKIIKEKMDQAKTYLLSAQQGASFKKDFMEQLDELKKDIKKDSIKYYQENKQQFIGKNDKTIEKIFKEEFWSL